MPGRMDRHGGSNPSPTLFRHTPSAHARMAARAWRTGRGTQYEPPRGGGSIPPSGTNPPDGFSFNNTVPPWASRPGGTPAPVAQRTERRFPEAGVAGPTPAMGTMPC